MGIEEALLTGCSGFERERNRLGAAQGSIYEHGLAIGMV